MALFVAVKFSQEEMPKIYDPGPLQDLLPQDFVVVPRQGTEDVAFVAALEHKGSEQVKLRAEPFARVIRRASVEEVEAFWLRKPEERRAFVVAKERARELRLDIKISHARIDPADGKVIIHFTSDQRIDFRALVKDLSASFKSRIELWQIGVRDEARFVDGFGVCGLQTCCSSWLTEFRPINIKMAKDQDINLPPPKLSGQCGRLLCCLSYEVDQYREMSREAHPKGATVEWEGKQVVIIDRNLLSRTYLISDGTGGLKNIKADVLAGLAVHVPEQMKKFGKKFRDTPTETTIVEESAPIAHPATDATVPEVPPSPRSTDHLSHGEVKLPPATPEPAGHGKKFRQREKDKDHKQKRENKDRSSAQSQPSEPTAVRPPTPPTTEREKPAERRPEKEANPRSKKERFKQRPRPPQGPAAPQQQKAGPPTPLPKGDDSGPDDAPETPGATGGPGRRKKKRRR